jgi:hypothetical protein
MKMERLDTSAAHPFKYLSLKDRLNLELVCHGWNDIVKQINKYTKKIDFSDFVSYQITKNSQDTLNIVNCALSKCGIHIQKIVFAMSFTISDDVLNLIRERCPKIKSLTFGHIRFTNINVVDNLRYFTTLEKLNMSDNNIQSDDPFPSLSRTSIRPLFEHMIRLKKLYIVRTQIFTDINNSFPIMRNRLTHLKLHYIYENQVDLSFPKLVYLSINLRVKVISFDCPHLKTLLLEAPFTEYIGNYKVSCDVILQNIPELEYLNCNNDELDNIIIPKSLNFLDILELKYLNELRLNILQQRYFDREKLNRFIIKLMTNLGPQLTKINFVFYKDFYLSDDASRSIIDNLSKDIEVFKMKEFGRMNVHTNINMNPELLDKLIHKLYSLNKYVNARFTSDVL